MSEHLNRRQTRMVAIRATETLNGAGLNAALHTLIGHILRMQDAPFPAPTATDDTELRAWFAALPPTTRSRDHLHLT